MLLSKASIFPPRLRQRSRPAVRVPLNAPSSAVGKSLNVAYSSLSLSISPEALTRALSFLLFSKKVVKPVLWCEAQQGKSLYGDWTCICRPSTSLSICTWAYPVQNVTYFSVIIDFLLLAYMWKRHLLICSILHVPARL